MKLFYRNFAYCTYEKKLVEVHQVFSLFFHQIYTAYSQCMKLCLIHASGQVGPSFALRTFWIRIHSFMQSDLAFFYHQIPENQCCGPESSISSESWSGSGSVSKVLMTQKNNSWKKKKIFFFKSAKKQFLSFWSKSAIYLFLGLLKGRPNYKRSLQPLKENMKFINFAGNFCLPGSGSRSTTLLKMLLLNYPYTGTHSR